MTEETRTPKQIIVLGTNGTGKTTFVKKLVISELKKKNSHILIVVPDDMEWNTIEFVHPKFPERIERYVGVRKIVYFKGLLSIINERFNNGLLVFDDCRKYFKAALDEELQGLMIRRRQKMIDIITVGHGFTQVPPAMFTFSTHYVLFRTKDNIRRRKDVIGEEDFEALEEAKIRINNNAIKEPHYFEIIKTV